MIIRISGIRLDGPEEHEHISHVRWGYDGGDNQDSMTRQQCVDWLESNTANQAFTAPPTGSGAQVSVRKIGTTKFLQSHADGVWKNNLLALPHY